MAPDFWKRYVDDALSLIKSSEFKDFIDHINSQDPHIKFTYEIESDNSIGLLDSNIRRVNNGLFEASVFRKKTHTERYLNFHSNHSAQHLKAVPNTLIRRALLLCSTKESLECELRHVGAVLKANDYPLTLVLKSVGKLSAPLFIIPHFKATLPTKTKTPTSSLSQASKSPQKTVFLPYVHPVSDRLKTFLKSRGYRVIFQTTTSMRQILVHPKDKLQKPEAKGVLSDPMCRQ